MVVLVPVGVVNEVSQACLVGLDREMCGVVLLGEMGSLASSCSSLKSNASMPFLVPFTECFLLLFCEGMYDSSLECRLLCSQQKDWTVTSWGRKEALGKKGGEVKVPPKAPWLLYAFMDQEKSLKKALQEHDVHFWVSCHYCFLF